MFKITDKRRARYLLDVREQGGHKFLHFIRTNKLRYLFVIGYFGVISVYSALTDAWFFFWVFFGFFAGVLLTDLTWLRAMQKSWPFIARATNWDEVKKVADQDTAS